MTQFLDEHSTAIEAKGLIPYKIGRIYLCVGTHRLKYLTEQTRNKDYERQLKNK